MNFREWQSPRAQPKPNVFVRRGRGTVLEMAFCCPFGCFTTAHVTETCSLWRAIKEGTSFVHPRLWGCVDAQRGPPQRHPVRLRVLAAGPVMVRRGSWTYSYCVPQLGV